MSDTETTDAWIGRTIRNVTLLGILVGFAFGICVFGLIDSVRDARVANGQVNRAVQPRPGPPNPSTAQPGPGLPSDNSAVTPK